MRRLTLCLLVDAFRPDYLRYAPYLRSLAGGSPGELREPFGFLPRAAYFGGLTPEQLGFSNMYAFDPDRSPFALARALRPGLPPAVVKRLRLRDQIDRSARSRLPAFAQAYATSAEIPLTVLPYFGVVEQHAPWARAVGYRSIFHEVEDRGGRWFECSWPLTNLLGDPSDRGIVTAALERATSDVEFGFVHLQELDGWGHRYGPGAPELRDRVRSTDALVEELIETLRGRFDAVELLVFGDHGMVSVTRALDLQAALDQLPLRAGTDYVWFLDSTMARFWPCGEAARERLQQALQGVAGVRLLTADDHARLQIGCCDWRNGEIVLLADPGVVIAPNFFQGAEPPAGMHGYDPDCADNRGVMICRSEAVQPSASIIDATEIHRLLRGMLRLPDVTQSGSVARRSRRSTPQHQERPSPPFTCDAHPRANEDIRRTLDLVTSRILSLAIDPEAILLTGSFGRGEGGVFLDGGHFVPVNDFDILVVGGRASADDLAVLGRAMAPRLGLDYMDIVRSDGRWAEWAPTMANFDLKYGSRVLHGNGDVLETLPEYAPGELPVFEGVQLLFNRVAGLLTGLRTSEMAGGFRNPRARRYLANQYVKAAVALGDSWLLTWRDYTASYRARGRRFAALAPGAGIPAALVEAVLQGYRLKVHPNYEAIPDIEGAVRALVPMLLDRLRSSIAECAGQPAASLADALAIYRRLPVHGDALADNARLMAREAVKDLVRTPPRDMSIRHLLYSALPLVLMRAPMGPAPEAEPAAWDVPAWLDVPAELVGREAWESARARIVAGWFEVIH